MNETDLSEKNSMVDRIAKSRLVKSFIFGLVITTCSLIIVGFNLSTNSGIKVNDNINRYFDTCVGMAFVESTPRIHTDERGFPLSYVQTNHVPICENNRAEIKRVSSTHFEVGAFFANVLFWACVVFVIFRTYKRRKNIKITKSA